MNIKPFLKWVGGKTRLINQIVSLMPKDFNNYYEPFLGGGALFLSSIILDNGRKAYLSDINNRLINTYHWVKYSPLELMTILDIFKKCHQHFPETYFYEQRGMFNDDLTLWNAARFIYLNKTCFNGIYRENSKKQFNVPIGKYSNVNLYDYETITKASIKLLNPRIVLSVCNYQNAFNDPLMCPQKDDFIYIDPPYYPISTTSNFTGYRGRFDKYDQKVLRNYILKLSDKGCKVMISNSYCQEVAELYNGFSLHRVSVGRSINSDINKRGKVNEFIITNY